MRLQILNFSLVCWENVFFSDFLFRMMYECPLKSFLFYLSIETRVVCGGFIRTVVLSLFRELETIINMKTKER